MAVSLLTDTVDGNATASRTMTSTANKINATGTEYYTQLRNKARLSFGSTKKSKISDYIAIISSTN